MYKIYSVIQAPTDIRDRKQYYTLIKGKQIHQEDIYK